MNQYLSYKGSGIEWIGDIPQEWNLSIVSRHFFLGRGRVISKEEIEENIGEYPVYSSQTKSNGILGYIDTFDFEGSYITWTTDGANCGTVSYRSGKFSTTNVCGLLSKKNIETRRVWRPLNLQYYLKKFQTYNIINAPKFYSNSLCVPSDDDISVADIDKISDHILKIYETVNNN